jgi:hypothetical protein
MKHSKARYGYVSLEVNHELASDTKRTLEGRTPA